MSNVHISTPELEKLDMTYEDFFRVLYVIVKHKIYYLRELYPGECIDDLSSYTLRICEKILKLSNTLHSIIVEHRDYVAANIILRSIADQISSLSFIYVNSNSEIRTLRHYLFILDGLKGRLKQLPHKIEYNGKIKQDEFNKLQLKVNSAIDNYNNAYVFSIEQIKRLELFWKYNDAIEVLIENCNWKFKKLSTSKNNAYSWKELYSWLNLPLDNEFFSLLSEFVHGLSTSNLVFNDDGLNFEPIISIADSLLGKLNNTIDTLYSKDIETIKPKLLSILADKDIPSKYLENIFSRIAKKEQE